VRKYSERSTDVAELRREQLWAHASAISGRLSRGNPSHFEGVALSYHPRAGIMSDDEEWPSSDDEHKAPVVSVPPAASEKPSLVGTSSAATASGSQRSLTAEVSLPAPVTPAAAMVKYEPQLLLFRPTLLFLHNPTQPLVAGATVLHNAIKRHFTFYFYDQTQRPLIFAEVPCATDGLDVDSALRCNPLQLILDGASASIKVEDSQKRQWKAQFNTRKDCISFVLHASLLVPLVATCLCSFKPVSRAVFQRDLLKGKHGTAKAGAFAHVAVKTFVFPTPPEFCDPRSAMYGESRQMQAFKAVNMEVDDGDTALWHHLRGMCVA